MLELAINIVALKYILDALPSAVAYSLRKLKSTATKAIRVKRVSDSAEQDIGFYNDYLDLISLFNFLAGSDGYVVKWYDQGGGGKDAVQTADATKQPKIVGTNLLTLANSMLGLLFDGSNDAFTISNLVASTTNTINTVIAEQAKTTQVLLGTAGTNYFGFNNTKYFAYYANNQYDQGVCYSDTLTKIFTSIQNGSDYRLFKNGIYFNSSGNFSGTQTPAISNIGGFSPYYYLGTMFELIVFNKALTLQERLFLENNQKNFYGIAAKKNVICNGNSLTQGYLATTGTEWPKVMANNLGSDYQVINIGITGQSTTQMIANKAVQIGNSYQSDAVKNIAVVWEITNDICAGNDATASYNNIVSYCQYLKVLGFKVVVGTCLPRGGNNAGTPGGASNFETIRQAVNTNIRNNYRDFADALADVGNDATIGVENAYNNTTYYNVDKVHLTPAGHGTAAGIFQTAVASL